MLDLASGSIDELITRRLTAAGRSAAMACQPEVAHGHPDPVARARELGAQIAAAADEIEGTRRIPEALLGRLHDSRLFRMLLPRSAGGDETEPAVYVAAIEELARHDASIAWNAFVATVPP
jgi:alkylation response protein AidB-like acyl-CoA dehydrogenase